MAKPMPEVLTLREQEALLRSPNLRYPTGVRNALLLRLMLHTGTPASQLVFLPWSDVDVNTGTVVFRLDLTEARWMDLGEMDAGILRQWLTHQVARLGRRPELVFTTLSGQQLGVRYIQQAIGRYAERAGIEKKVRPHTLFYTYAAAMWQFLGTADAVQAAVGIRSLTTVRGYRYSSASRVHTDEMVLPRRVTPGSPSALAT